MRYMLSNISIFFTENIKNIGDQTLAETILKHTTLLHTETSTKGMFQNN